MAPIIKEFFDPDTWTLSYIVYDSDTRDAVIIDPVWDYDPAASKLTDRSLRKLLSFVNEMKLQVHLIMETHAHADHLSSSQLLKKEFPASKLAIGAKIQNVQQVFKKIYNLDNEFATDGSQFDLLLRDGDKVKAGSLTIAALETPGHTPACMSYIIGEHVFTGDALFMPDYGTGRCDFPAGSAEDLYESVHEKL